MQKGKRGLSTVIVTLILILVSIVAVGIIWVVVRNILNSGTNQVDFGKFTLSLDVKNAYVQNDNLSVDVKRNAGQGELTQIKFLLSDGENSEVITQDTNLKELEERVFSLHLTILNASRVIKVSIVPVFKASDGTNSFGQESSTYNIGSGNQGSQQPSGSCSPQTCSGLGYNCGTWSNGTCSGTLSCGNCSGGQTCNSNGACVSSCTPTTCAALGYNCGSGYANGTCSGNLDCGNCSVGQSCVGGSCISSCTPATCYSLGYN
jgi:hypothetical protein